MLVFFGRGGAGLYIAPSDRKTDWMVLVPPVKSHTDAKKGYSDVVETMTKNPPMQCTIEGSDEVPVSRRQLDRRSEPRRMSND